MNKTTGDWDAAAETMSFRADIANGLTSQSSVHFIDADHHEWRVVVSDGTGKVYFNTTWTCVRQK